MTMEVKHISVCICTFKRQEQLKRLFNALENQVTDGLFSYSIVVADNDYKQSAQKIAAQFNVRSSMEIKYCVEPVQNIAMARNKAIENSEGDYIAFIDDDEYPENTWLKYLFQACNTYGADGILGPVKPHFDHKPPQWIIKGEFFKRPSHETGYKMHWSETRTGNVLFKREIIQGIQYPFDPQFGTGSEDVDFFRRMMVRGRIFVWCNEAIVYEVIPAKRCTRSYLLRLALLRGGNSLKHPKNRMQNIIKSIIALPVYGLILPFLIFVGQYLFMYYMIRLCDHTGRLLALLSINPVKKRDF